MRVAAARIPFLSLMKTKKPARRPSPNPVAFTAENKRILPLKPREARKLIAYGYAEWRGRKEGMAITVFIPVNAVLAFVGQERLRPTPEARGLDSKTHGFTGPRTYHHIRNETYFGGLHRTLACKGATADQVAELVR